MYPEVFSLGVLHVRSYGLMLAVAFLVGTWLGLKEARRLRLDPDHLVTVVLATLVSSVVGARLLYVVEHIGEFQGQWPSVLAVWQGGLTLYGGVVAGTFAALVTSRRLGMPAWTVADALAPSVALGTMFGRIGCFLNGCCYGRPTSLPWGVEYPLDSFAGLEFGHTPIHPAQIYNALFGLVLFGVLWRMRTRVRVPGTLFWLFIVSFTLGRIVLDFFRAYEPAARIVPVGPWEITESQLTSLVFALFGVLMLFRVRRAALKSAPPVSPPVSETS